LRVLIGIVDIGLARASRTARWFENTAMVVFSTVAACGAGPPLGPNVTSWP
jgi:hypothetical protein